MRCYFCFMYCICVLERARRFRKESVPCRLFTYWIAKTTYMHTEESGLNDNVGVNICLIKRVRGNYTREWAWKSAMSRNATDSVCDTIRYWMAVMVAPVQTASGRSDVPLFLDPLVLSSTWCGGSETRSWPGSQRVGALWRWRGVQTLRDSDCSENSAPEHAAGLVWMQCACVALYCPSYWPIVSL